MKAVLQRVANASVVVDGETVGKIGKGLLILLCAERGDTDKESDFLARKSVDLRIFSDDAGKMNLSVKDVGGSILVVSQFTLAAEWKKGRRPSFIKAAEPTDGERLYEHFKQVIASLAVPVECGKFGAHMDVSLVNDGPVTLILDHQFGTDEPL